MSSPPFVKFRDFSFHVESVKAVEFKLRPSFPNSVISKNDGISPFCTHELSSLLA